MRRKVSIGGGESPAFKHWAEEEPSKENEVREEGDRNMESQNSRVGNSIKKKGTLSYVECY